MSIPHPPAAADAKAEVSQLEATPGESKAVVFVTDNSNEISNDAKWTFWQTVRYYWKAMLISFGCGVCAMGDGYDFNIRFLYQF